MIEHIWEFRAGCHNSDSHDTHAQPCACHSCATKRVAAVAEQPELDDADFVQFVGDKTRYSVRELRAAAASRTAAAADATDAPPDPYAAGIAAMRAKESR